MESLTATQVLRVTSLRKRYGDTEVVAGTNLAIARGECFGLLGPNGAGKTTTVEMLTTLLIPTAGSASVRGFDVVRQAEEVRKRIGFIFGCERGLSSSAFRFFQRMRDSDGGGARGPPP